MFFHCWKKDRTPISAQMPNNKDTHIGIPVMFPSCLCSPAHLQSMGNCLGGCNFVQKSVTVNDGGKKTNHGIA